MCHTELSDSGSRIIEKYLKSKTILFSSLRVFCIFLHYVLLLVTSCYILQLLPGVGKQPGFGQTSSKPGVFESLRDAYQQPCSFSTEVLGLLYKDYKGTSRESFSQKALKDSA